MNVRSVNSADRTIELVQSGREQSPVRVHYDANTRVEFQGRSYNPKIWSATTGCTSERTAPVAS